MLKEAVPMLQRHGMSTKHGQRVIVPYNTGSLVHGMVRHPVNDIDLESITL